MSTLSQSSPRPTHTVGLSYAARGNPTEVLQLVKHELSTSLKPDEVLLQSLASPINPSDINMVEGTYAILPELPAIGGGEGSSRVVEVGSGVTDLKVGDVVLPAEPGLGTWQSYSVRKTSQLLHTPTFNDISPLQSSTLAVNPCSAYRMLKDYVQLSTDNSVVINGANSAVGVAAIQLCKLYGYKSIAIVRTRPDLQELKQLLTELGATLVVTDEEFASREMKKTLASNDVAAPLLGLNCVGGSASSDMSRILATGGTMVTYGGMSKRPVTIGTSQFIFNDLICRGFWLSRWVKQHSRDERLAMLEELAQMVKNGQLKSIVTEVKFLADSSESDVKKGIDEAMQGRKIAKVVFTFD